MKKKQTDILNHINRKSGFNVPENYFDDFASKMESILPQHEVIPEVKPTTWNRIRPYVYMTAMFAGIWCMMWIFNDIMSVSSHTDFNKTMIAGLQNEEYINEYILLDDISEYDIYTYQDSIDGDLF